MRRLKALLIAAGLAAAPIGAVAGPGPERTPPGAPGPSQPWSTARPRLGVLVMELTPELRTHFGAPDHSGVLVGQVEPGSPAAKAGILVGDVMVDVRGHSIDDASDVRAALANVGKGQTVPIKLMRDRKPLTLQVTLATEAAPGWGESSRSVPRWLREWVPPLSPERQTST